MALSGFKPCRGTTWRGGAEALDALHSGLRSIDLPVPYFTHRVAEAQQIVGDRTCSPTLGENERAFLVGALQSLQRAVVARTRVERRLHGEPHAGNVLRTREDLRFIDLETCCLGPVEFDLAHPPERSAPFTRTPTSCWSANAGC